MRGRGRPDATFELAAVSLATNMNISYDNFVFVLATAARVMESVRVDVFAFDERPAVVTPSAIADIVEDGDEFDDVDAVLVKSLSGTSLSSMDSRQLIVRLRMSVRVRHVEACLALLARQRTHGMRERALPQDYAPMVIKVNGDDLRDVEVQRLVIGGVHGGDAVDLSIQVSSLRPHGTFLASVSCAMRSHIPREAVAWLALSFKRFANPTVRLQVAGGVAPYSLSLLGGFSPPPGVVVDVGAMRIHGVATTCGVFSLLMMVQDSRSYVSMRIDFLVRLSPPHEGAWLQVGDRLKIRYDDGDYVCRIVEVERRVASSEPYTTVAMARDRYVDHVNLGGDVRLYKRRREVYHCRQRNDDDS